MDADTDQSIIVELLAYEDTVTDPEALNHHWNELAEGNGASGDNATITAMQVLTPEMVPGVPYVLRTTAVCVV